MFHIVLHQDLRFREHRISTGVYMHWHFYIQKGGTTISGWKLHTVSPGSHTHLGMDAHLTEV